MRYGLTMLSHPGMIHATQFLTDPFLATNRTPPSAHLLPLSNAQTGITSAAGALTSMPMSRALKTPLTTTEPATSPSLRLPKAADRAFADAIEGLVESMWGIASNATAAAHDSARTCYENATDWADAHKTHFAQLALAATLSALIAGCDMQLTPEVASKLPGVLKDALLFKTLGGLGMLFFGLYTMEAALKAASADKIKKVLTTLTTNRLAGLATGTIGTATWQSSSVTTVMLVGLVTAGLMNLEQAMSVVCGANIGTTMTGWLFALKIVKYGLPMIGVGAIAALFVKNYPKLQNFGKATLGIGLVFEGLETMSAGFKDPIVKQALHSVFSHFAGTSHWDVLKCIIVAMIATEIVQSSSATLGVIIALAGTGVIPFETSVGLVIGINIGTTITAVLAALRPGTPRAAQQVAASHVGFNVIGAALVFPFAPYYIDGLHQASQILGIESIEKQVAFSHTAFNIVLSALFIAALTPYRKLITRILPDKKEATAEYLDALKPEILKQEPEFALEAGRKVLIGAAEDIQKMSALLTAAILQSDPEVARKNARDGDVIEGRLDRVQRRMGKWTVHLETQGYALSVSRAINSMQRIVSELETVSDILHRMLEKVAELRSMPGFVMSEEMKSRLSAVHEDVFAFFAQLRDGIVEPRKLEGKKKIRWKDAQEMRRVLLPFIEAQQEAVVESLLAANGHAQADTPAELSRQDERESQTSAIITRIGEIFRSYRDTVMAWENIAKALAGKKY